MKADMRPRFFSFPAGFMTRFDKRVKDGILFSSPKNGVSSQRL
jgi:hypothetical protein